MLIDTHCHIHDRKTYEFALTRQQAGKKLRQMLTEDPAYGHYPLTIEDYTAEKMLERAKNAGVEKVVLATTSYDDMGEAQTLAMEHANVFWAMGIHPDEAQGVSRDAVFETPSSGTLPVAIGEVGLDYHDAVAAIDSNYRQNQIRLFEQCLDCATDMDLPVIFHVREAFDDFFAVLKNFPGVRGVVHSFSDSMENLERSLGSGYYIGVNGMATFSSDIPLPPLERMLLETDAPFLTPAPFRGTINEPAHIRDICAYIAKIKGESEQQVAKITTKNAEQLFKI